MTIIAASFNYDSSSLCCFNLPTGSAASTNSLMQCVRPNSCIPHLNWADARSRQKSQDFKNSTHVLRLKSAEMLSAVAFFHCYWLDWWRQLTASCQVNSQNCSALFIHRHIYAESSLCSHAVFATSNSSTVTVIYGDLVASQAATIILSYAASCS